MSWKQERQGSHVTGMRASFISVQYNNTVFTNANVTGQRIHNHRRAMELWAGFVSTEMATARDFACCLHITPQGYESYTFRGVVGV